MLNILVNETTEIAAERNDVNRFILLSISKGSNSNNGNHFESSAVAAFMLRETTNPLSKLIIPHNQRSKQVTRTTNSVRSYGWRLLGMHTHNYLTFHFAENEQRSKAILSFLLQKLILISENDKRISRSSNRKQK